MTVAGHAGTDVHPVGSLSNPTPLTFTTSNCDTAQTVTVTAGNDADTTDDSVTLTQVRGAARTATTAASPIAAVVVTVRDDDGADG